MTCGVEKLMVWLPDSEKNVAVCEILSVKERPGLQISVWGRSRSLKIARFDRPCMTFYWSAIVTISLLCTVFELFDVE